MMVLEVRGGTIDPQQSRVAAACQRMLSHQVARQLVVVLGDRGHNAAGSVIGVACRYKTLGLSANTVAAASAAAADSVNVCTIHAMAEVAIANATIEIQK